MYCRTEKNEKILGYFHILKTKVHFQKELKTVIRNLLITTYGMQYFHFE